jgi:hypothetical protein
MGSWETFKGGEAAKSNRSIGRRGSMGMLVPIEDSK